jgi:hypothetical protein
MKDYEAAALSFPYRHQPQKAGALLPAAALSKALLEAVK